jgi:hypothetical protein
MSSDSLPSQIKQDAEIIANQMAAMNNNTTRSALVGEEETNELSIHTGLNRKEDSSSAMGDYN